MKQIRQIFHKNTLILSQSWQPRYFYWAVLALVVFSFFIYGRSLSNGFTNWDDQTYLESPTILNFDISAMIRTTTLTQYFPLTIFSFAVDEAICKGGAFCFHFSSLVIHILSSILVLIIALKLFRLSLVTSLLCAVLFAAHPMNVEVISWLSARNHALSGLLQLATFGLYLFYLDLFNSSATDRKKNLYFLAIYGLFILALLAKISALMLPVLLLYLDIAQKRKDWVRIMTEKFLLFLPALFLTYISLDNLTPGPLHTIFDLTFVERFIWACKGVLFYLGRILIPHDLSVYYEVQIFQLDLIDIAAGCVGILIWFAAPLLLKKDRALAWLGGVGFFIFFLPISKLKAFGDDSIFNDRYMYLSIAFLFCSLFFIAKNIYQENSAWFSKWINRTSILIFVTIYGLFLASYTFARSQVWENSKALWSDTLNHNPSALAYNNLGRVFFETEHWEEAQPYFKKSIELKPNYSLPYYNLGLSYSYLQRPEEALNYFKKVVEVDPTFKEAYLNIGVIYLDFKHDKTAALQAFTQALKAGADMPALHFQTAELLSEFGKADEAEQHYLATLKADPSFAASYLRLANIYSQRGEKEKADAFLKKAIFLNPATKPKQ